MDEVTKVEPTGKRGGEWITFGAESYRVPPLSLGAVQELQERIRALQASAGEVPTRDQMQTIVDVVHAAMVRNYPDMKATDVAELVDLENYQHVLGAVLRIAGFKAPEPGEPSGEAQASTGAASTSP